MATYSSFKKIDSDAIVDATVVAADIAADTIPTADIAATSVPGTAFSGTVTDAKLAATLDLSAKTVVYRPIVDGDISGSAGIAGAKLASGAATGNLGFTPVNQAGDTVSGQLLVPAGSAGSPSIQYSGSTNSGINFTTNNVAIVAGGNTGVNIDANGVITRPNHPSFCAHANAGWLYAPSYGGTGEYESGNIMGWSVSHQYGGSNWNNNGRFTAPVAGYYTFNTWWYLLNDANTPPNYVHLFIRKNNSRSWTPGGRSPYIINMHQNTNSYDDGVPHTAVIQMAAGDYASNAIVWHGNSSRHHAGHHIFNGHLIG
jgi:hypothetical protein